MNVAHFVLKFRGSAPPQSDLDRIDRASGITVLDRIANRAMLLEASPDAAAALDRQLPNWTVAEEVTYPLPETRRSTA
jgi:hypothetical protein